MKARPRSDAIILAVAGMLGGVTVLAAIPHAEATSGRQRSSATITGALSIQGGAELIGGYVGEVLSVTVNLTATSSNGAVTAMRLATGKTQGCAPAGQLERSPWLPFTRTAVVTTTVWRGFTPFAVTAQVEDVTGEVSAPFCDYTVLEGVPKPAPSATVSPGVRPTATSTSTPQPPRLYLPTLAKSRDPPPAQPRH